MFSTLYRPQTQHFGHSSLEFTPLFEFYKWKKSAHVRQAKYHVHIYHHKIYLRSLIIAIVAQ